MSEAESNIQTQSEENNVEFISIKKALSAFFSILLFATGLALGLSTGPVGSGITIVIAIIIYALVFTLGPEIRMPFLSLAIGTHVGFLYTQKAHIMLYPLFIIFKDKVGGSLAFDFIQLIVYGEVIAFFIRKKTKGHDQLDLSDIDENYNDKRNS